MYNEDKTIEQMIKSLETTGFRRDYLIAWIELLAKRGIRIRKSDIIDYLNMVGRISN